MDHRGSLVSQALQLGHLALGDALGDLAVGVVQVAEDQGLVGTGLHTPRFFAGVVRIVQQVGAHGAFLGDLLLLVPVHRAHRAGVHDLLLALGLDGIDDDDAVLALVHRPVLGSGHAGGVVAVGTGSGDGGGLDAPLVVPPLPLFDVHPELAHVGLGLGNGGVPAAVLVLAGHEAGVAGHAAGGVDGNAVFHLTWPPFRQRASRPRRMFFRSGTSAGRPPPPGCARSPGRGWGQARPCRCRCCRSWAPWRGYSRP